MKSKPVDNITRALITADAAYCEHPREMIDFVCVADLGTWVTRRFAGFSREQPKQPWSREIWKDEETLWNILRNQYHLPEEGAPFTMIAEPHADDPEPIGVMLARLTRLLSYEDPALRSIAEYFHETRVFPHNWSVHTTRAWTWDIYTDRVRERVRAGELDAGFHGSHWSLGY